MSGPRESIRKTEAVLLPLAAAQPRTPLKPLDDDHPIIRVPLGTTVNDCRRSAALVTGDGDPGVSPLAIHFRRSAASAFAL